jgi:hypothetical protein
MKHLLYWVSIRESQLKQPTSAPDPLWDILLLPVTRGEAHDIQNWREFHKRFGVTVTQHTDAAQDFFCDRIQLHHVVPLDRQWIYATNKLVNRVKHNLQQWRRQEA